MISSMAGSADKPRCSPPLLFTKVLNGNQRRNDDRDYSKNCEVADRRERYPHAIKKSLEH